MRELAPDERAALVMAVGEAIRAHVLERPPSPSPSEVSRAPREPAGVFVSLYVGEDLKGCIGQPRARAPLIDTAREMGIAAASLDPRFDPVSRVDLSGDGILLEISCLSPLRRYRLGDPFTPGQDGLYLVSGGATGLLLPQVAARYGWDRKTFFDHTAVKAGLPPAAWSDPGTDLYTFKVRRYRGRITEAGVEVLPHEGEG